MTEQANYLSFDRLVHELHICPSCWSQGVTVALQPNGPNCYICRACGEMFGVCND